MSNQVTFETALKLKEAGFPQPKPLAGQFWWVDEKNIDGSHYRYSMFIIIASWQGWLAGVAFPVNTNTCERRADKMDVFAPSATDILSKLPGCRLELNIDYKTASGESWSCEKFSHETSPAEACALAWLAENEKK